MADSNDKETAVRERCTECGSEDFRIVHYLQENHHDRIFFECAKCGHFSARVIVHAYVNPDYCEEGLLRSMTSLGFEESGRTALTEYKKHAERAGNQFVKVKQLLDEGPSEERNIRKLYHEFQIEEDG